MRENQKYRAGVFACVEFREPLAHLRVTHSGTDIVVRELLDFVIRYKRINGFVVRQDI